MRSRTLSLLASMLAALACTSRVDLPWRAGPPLSPSPCPSPIWTAGMETGDLSQWNTPTGAGGGFSYGASSVIAAMGTAHTGSWAARFDLSTPPNGGTMLGRSLEPSEEPALFYEAWLYLPQLYTLAGTNPYWDIIDFAEMNSAGTQYFSIGIEDSSGVPFFNGFSDVSQTSYYQYSVPAPVATWFRLDVYYLCSATPGSVPRLALWQDGIPLFQTTSETTAFPGAGCQWEIGSDSRQLLPSPSRLFLDDAAIYPNCGS